MLVAMMNLLGFGWFEEFACSILAAEQAHGQGSQSAASGCAACDHCSGCHAHRAHMLLLKGKLGHRRGLLHEGGRFVRTWSPTRGHRDIEQTQVDTELAAMLVPMAEHDVANKSFARLSHHFVTASYHLPCFFHA